MINEIFELFLTFNHDHLLYVFLFLFQDPSQDDWVLLSALRLLYRFAEEDSPSFINEVIVRSTESLPSYS